jgi:hypothetical protein
MVISNRQKGSMTRKMEALGCAKEHCGNLQLRFKNGEQRNPKMWRYRRNRESTFVDVKSWTSACTSPPPLIHTLAGRCRWPPPPRPAIGAGTPGGATKIGLSRPFTLRPSHRARRQENLCCCVTFRPFPLFPRMQNMEEQEEVEGAQVC